MAEEFVLPGGLLVQRQLASDAGISTGGSTTTLVDLTKTWGVNIWQGALLIIAVENLLYFTNISGNFEQQLNFPAFPSNVKITQNPYVIISDALTASQLLTILQFLLTKTATQILNVASIAALAKTALASCTPVNMVYGVSGLALTVKCSFDAAATLGIRVHVVSSYDGVNFDTQDFDTWLPTFIAGATIQVTKVYDVSVAYLAVIIENLDPAKTVTTVSVYSTVRG